MIYLRVHKIAYVYANIHYCILIINQMTLMGDLFIKAPRHCNYKLRYNRYVLLLNIFDLRGLSTGLLLLWGVFGGYCFGTDFGHDVMENTTATLSATMIILTISPLTSDIASKTFNWTFWRIRQEDVADICSVFFIVLFFCHPL